MTMNGKFENLLRAEKKTWFTKRKIIFYSILGVSIILFIISLSSLSYADPFERSLSDFFHTVISSARLQEITDTFGTPIPEGIAGVDLIISMPVWSIGAFITSAAGFGSTILASSLSKTMLFEDKNWLRIWNKKGTLSAHYMFKRVQIQLENNKISILKIGKKYRVKIPIQEGLNLARFGFKTKNNFFVGYFAKEELASTIHVLTTQL